MSKRTKKPKMKNCTPWYYKKRNVKKREWERYRKMVPVLIPPRDVWIELTADNVLESISLKGAGNSQTCSGAVCVVRHENLFPHPVEDSQWTDSRLYVANKLDKEGYPLECYGYQHNCGWVSKLNDGPLGQRELLKLVQENGPQKIHLRPIRIQLHYHPPIPRPRPTPVPRPKNPRGPGLRAARVEPGAV